MRNIKYLATILIVALALASCAPSTPSVTPGSPAESSSPEPVPQAHYEASIYKTKEDFYAAIIETKNVSAGITGSNSANGTIGDVERGTAIHNQVDEITWYFDFTNLVGEVVLGDIIVKPEYIVLYYNDKDNEGGSGISSLSLNCYRKGDVDEELYLARDRTANTIDTVIYGKTVLKIEGNHFGTNQYLGNQYNWVENGYAMELRVPHWLLELYPEETFFDIQVVTVPTEKSGDAE